MDKGENLAFSLIEQWNNGQATGVAIQNIAHAAVQDGHLNACLVEIAKAGDWGLHPSKIARDLKAFAVVLPHRYVLPDDLSTVIVPDDQEVLQRICDHQEEFQCIYDYYQEGNCSC